MGKVCFAVGSEAGEQPSFIDGSSSKAVRKVPFTLDVVKPLIRTLAVEKESEVCSCIGALENLAIYTNPECLIALHVLFYPRDTQDFLNIFSPRKGNTPMSCCP